MVVNLTLVDPSTDDLALPAGIELLCFAASADELPTVHRPGDIIRLHRVKVLCMPGCGRNRLAEGRAGGCLASCAARQLEPQARTAHATATAPSPRLSSPFCCRSIASKKSLSCWAKWVSAAAASLSASLMARRRCRRRCRRRRARWRSRPACRWLPTSTPRSTTTAMSWRSGCWVACCAISTRSARRSCGATQPTCAACATCAPKSSLTQPPGCWQVRIAGRGRVWKAEEGCIRRRCCASSGSPSQATLPRAAPARARHGSMSGWPHTTCS